MKRLTIKYKLVCLAVACCAIFTACEQADLATKSPMTFKNGQVRVIADADANARVFAYRVTEGNATPEWLYGTATKGANAQLTNINFENKKLLLQWMVKLNIGPMPLIISSLSILKHLLSQEVANLNLMQQQKRLHSLTL